MISFFKKRVPVEDRRKQRDALSLRLDDARSDVEAAHVAAVGLALDAANSAALDEAETRLRIAQDRVRTLEDALTAIDAEIKAQAAKEWADADNKVRQATSRTLQSQADHIGKTLPPLIDALRNAQTAIEAARPIIGDVGMFTLFDQLAKEFPPSFGIIAAELRARATAIIEHRASAELPAPAAPSAPMLELPTLPVFCMVDIRWSDPVQNAPTSAARWSFAGLPVPLAEKALSLGWAISPDDPRVKDLSKGRSSYAPAQFLERCHDLDTGELPAPPPMYLPYGAHRPAIAPENYRANEPVRTVTIPGAAAMPEPLGARSLKADDDD